jgi:hypothetical protein
MINSVICNSAYCNACSTRFCRSCYLSNEHKKCSKKDKKIIEMQDERMKELVNNIIQTPTPPSTPTQTLTEFPQIGESGVILGHSIYGQDLFYTSQPWNGWMYGRYEDHF